MTDYRIFLVFWGTSFPPDPYNQWPSEPFTAEQLFDALSTVRDSGYFSGLGQYSVGQVQINSPVLQFQSQPLKPGVVIGGRHWVATFTDADVIEFILQAFGGGLPQPNQLAPTKPVYVVMPPWGSLHLIGSQPDTKNLAAHSVFSLPFSPYSMIWAWNPIQSKLNDTTHVLTHEIVEALGLDGGAPKELCDDCQTANPAGAKGAGGFTVETYFDAARNVCIAPPFFLPATVGVFRPADEDQWLLRNSNTPGNPDISFAYGAYGDIPVVGDWTGNDMTTIGVFRPATGQWLLRNSNTPGNPDISFAYGSKEHIPVVGDWTGNGKTTIGLYDPAKGQWLLRNSNTTGYPDISFAYGGTGDIPVVGDWTGSGKTTIGVFRPSTAQWLLRNSNTPGNPDISFAYGASGGLSGDVPVVGDWIGNGITTIGVFRPAGSHYNQTTEDQWLLRKSNTPGNPDISFAYGARGDMPVVGQWKDWHS